MAIDPVIVSSMTGAAEEAINKALHYAPASQKLIDQLDGSIIDLCIGALNIRLQFSNQRLFMHQRTDESPAHATISGSPLALLRIATSTETLANMGNNGVTVEGDSETIQHLYALAKTLDIDYEAMLAEITGGIPAHFIGNSFRSLRKWTQAANESMESNIQEYLQEEGRQVPARVEAELFAADIDELTLAVDRLEARIQLLLQQQKVSPNT